VWCETALAADKGNVANQFLYASILLAAGAVKEAVDALQRTLYLDANFIMAHVTLGMIAHQQRSSKSRRHFDNARRLLRQSPLDAIVPESEGMTAAQLSNILDIMVNDQQTVAAVS
jgi:chemotaxis protein methyltransferase CheR